MKKIFNSEQYLGSRKKNYFEGWYFRHTTEKPFAFIVGISKSEKDSHSFIQYIDCEDSFYFRYPAEDFSYNPQNAEIKIQNNTFSETGISADIDKDGQVITADLCYSGLHRFKKTPFSPSVMGPFSYVPMVCNHSLISLNHAADGKLRKNGRLSAVKGRGYIEKDFGNKFPDNYFWLHASNDKTSIMCAVAWPLIFKMRGFLCVISDKENQYNLSLYSGAKLKRFEVSPDKVELLIKKGGSYLELTAKTNSDAQRLIAPDKGGKMSIGIMENLNAECSAKLTIKNESIDLSDIETAAFETVLK